MLKNKTKQISHEELKL